MRALIYARVSTDEQGNNYSLPSQIAACRAYAERNGFTIVAEVQDVASGAKLDRPGLTRIRNMIRAGDSTALIVYTSDRLTRSLAHSLLLREELKAAGVALHAVTKGQASADTPEGGLMENVEAAFAEYERLKIRERTLRGLKGKAQAGLLVASGGRAPFGYRWEGRNRDRRLVIVESDAVTVRYIFTQYAAGAGVAQIIRDLAAMQAPSSAARYGNVGRGIKKRAAADWSSSAIYHILHNETYAGTVYCHGIPVPVPALINRATWDAAQARLATGRQNAARNTKRFYLLSKRISCGCGYAAIGRPSRARRCYCCASRANGNIRRCTIPQFDAETVERIVWDWITTHVLTEDRLIAALEEHRRQAAAVKRDADARKEALYTEKSTLQGEIDRLYDRYARGAMDDDTLDRLLSPRKGALAVIDAEIARLAATESGISADDETLLLDTARQVAAMIADENAMADATKRQIIEILDVRTVLRYEDGVKSLDVSVALTRDTTNVAFNSKHLR